MGIQPATEYLYEMINGFRGKDAPTEPKRTDQEWAAEQTQFPHTLPMPRSLKTFCPDCVDAVLDIARNKYLRTTRGVYLPIDHECNSVRVYDLAGKLRENC